VAGRIRQEDVEAVRERTDMVKLVGQYLTLKKAGGDNMTGLCPFHQEKTPSFSISPAKQLFYCHGCGKGGDAIGFLRELEHLSFTEAVERLAQQAGITLRYEGDSPAERRAAARRIALIKARPRRRAPTSRAAASPPSPSNDSGSAMRPRTRTSCCGT
jgi:DNA primase